MYVDLAPHQTAALKKLKNGSILWGGVGVGKSRVALAYYLDCEEPEDLIVITTAKKRDSLDWEGEAVKFGIGKSKDASVAGVIKVDSWNNISKYKDTENAFFIFDEQRLVGSGTWVKSFIKIAKKNRWILLTATPGDTWLDYIPVFVANGFYKNRTAFLQEHVIYNTWSKFPKVDRYVGVGKLVRLKNQILVEMPYEKHTIRHVQEVKVDYDKDLFHKATVARWNVFEQRPLRDVAELFLVMRKIVNSDPSRLDAVRELMKEQPRLIIFYNFDYELEILRTLAGACPLAECEKEEACQKTSTPSTSQETQSDLLRAKTSHTPISQKSSTEVNSSNNSKKNSSRNSTPTSTKSLRSSFLDTGRSLKVDSLLQNDQMTSSLQPKKNTNMQDVTDSGRTGVKPKTESSTTRSTKNTVSFAEWNGHKHEPIPDTERWVYLVQYVAGSEGWNCISTNAAVFYSLTYSYKIFEQAHGRIDRLNTPYTNLYYYVLVSDSLIDRAILKALRSKKNFNERQFGTSSVGGVGYKQPSGYITLKSPTHPLADSNGRVLQHRLVLYNVIGSGKHCCYWCGRSIEWEDGSLEVDHLNNNKTDNRFENLVPSCKKCNVDRAKNKNNKLYYS